MWRELNTPCVYTVEASFFGPSNVPSSHLARMEPQNDDHFAPAHLMGVGRQVCCALQVYFRIKEQLLSDRGQSVGVAAAGKTKTVSPGPEERLRGRSGNSLAGAIFKEICANREILFGTFLR